MNEQMKLRWVRVQLWALGKLGGLLGWFGYTPQWIRGRLISLSLRTPEGKAKLSRAMMNPIRQRLEENRFARQTMPIQAIPDETP